jgi:hypothetical protein
MAGPALAVFAVAAAAAVVGCRALWRAARGRAPET